MADLDVHSARAYFLQHVIPEYESLQETLNDGFFGMRREIRALGRAAEACLHLADHVARDSTCNSTIEGAPKAKLYIEALTQRSSAFALVRDVANCFKHGAITRAGARVASLDSFHERWVLVRYEDDSGFYYDIRKTVMVQTLSGAMASAEKIVRLALNAWCEELVTLGAIPSPAQIDDGKPLYIARSKCPPTPGITFLCEEGEHFSAKPMEAIYDSEHAVLRAPSRGDRIKTNVRAYFQVHPSRFSSTPRHLHRTHLSILSVEGDGTPQ